MEFHGLGIDLGLMVLLMVVGFWFVMRSYRNNGRIATFLQRFSSGINMRDELEEEHIPLSEYAPYGYAAMHSSSRRSRAESKDK